jgi:hypothetical protein
VKVSLDEIARIQQVVERAKEDGQRAAGALEQIMSTLARDFGCETIEDAERKLAKLDSRLSRDETELAMAIEEFRTKYEGA